jgi:hypothetical protein
LERIDDGLETISRATFKKVEKIEDQDSDFEIFKRRMSMRQYFKELKMNL